MMRSQRRFAHSVRDFNRRFPIRRSQHMLLKTQKKSTNQWKAIQSKTIITCPVYYSTIIKNYIKWRATSTKGFGNL